MNILNLDEVLRDELYQISFQKEEKCILFVLFIRFRREKREVFFSDERMTNGLLASEIKKLRLSAALLWPCLIATFKPDYTNTNESRDFSRLRRHSAK